MDSESVADEAYRTAFHGALCLVWRCPAWVRPRSQCRGPWCPAWSSQLLWGGLLLLGALASILTTGLQRQQLASGRPEQYLAVWHKKADSRPSNPFLYLGRHTEFIIRRCFLPYVFLFFALFHITNWLLIGATAGANIVWTIALYSYLTFAPSQTSTLPTRSVA